MSSEAVAAGDEAGRRATEAADKLGIRVVELVHASAHHEAAALLQKIWHADTPDVVLGAATMTALAHAGNYVVGAYRDTAIPNTAIPDSAIPNTAMVAAAVAFFGVRSLHSHVAGVDRDLPIRGVGFALKQHQRAWALARGITEVCWTFDPLIGRNANFNLHKLGARAVDYLPDFYGGLDDGVNDGDPTDRLYVSWDLCSPEAVAAAGGTPVAAVAAPDAVVLVGRDGDLPVTGDPLPSDGRPVRVAVPEDAETLRARDPAAAARWRYTVRDAMQAAFVAGYHVVGISRDGCYTLTTSAEVGS